MHSMQNCNDCVLGMVRENQKIPKANNVRKKTNESDVSKTATTTKKRKINERIKTASNSLKNANNLNRNYD